MADRALREPGCDPAQQHAGQQHDEQDDEQRHAKARRGQHVDRHERVEIDHHELPVGEGEHDQGHAQRHQNDPSHNSFDHKDMPWPDRPFSLLAVEPLTNFLAGLELRHVFLAHIDLLAGAWIASDPGWPVLDRKCPEAAQFHPVTARHRIADLIEDGIDDVFYVALEEMWILVRQFLH
jgi:hypothetical protein